MKDAAAARPSLFKLFYSMLYISAFTFGGGFVIVTLMKRRFVDELKWLDTQEMLDLTALAQSAPGAIAVNAAILVGKRLRGMPGMLSALLGTIIPPVAILLIISRLYAAFASNVYVSTALSGMGAGIAAVIADVAISLGGGVAKEKDALSIGIMVAAFVASFVFNVNAVYIILSALAIGAAKAICARRKRYER
jgi:chromate transporter